ncbi:MAG: DUF1573 domain-containing protein [Planctomycetota bacterium]|nr:MAG: DUF1573 domain-containing protein [Planctomycetota bacterium]
MKPFTWIVLPVLGAALSAGQDPQGQASRSRLLIEPAEMDLGEIRQAEYPLEFRFRVEGPDPVVFQEILSSCGCTNFRLELDGRRLNPGDSLPAAASGLVVGVFDARQYRNEKRTWLRLVSNAANGYAEGRIRAWIRPTFVLKPPVVRFGEVAQATVRAGSSMVPLRVQSDRPFTVDGWSELPEGVAIEDAGMVEEDEQKGVYVRLLQVRLVPAAPSGMLFGTAVARTSLEHDLEVTVQATVLGPVQYFPAGRLSFGLCEPGQERSLALRVQAAAGVQLPQPDLRLEGDAVFSAELGASQAGRLYTVQVKLKPDAAAGVHRARLHIGYPQDSGLPAHEALVVATVKGAE